ncbi:MAG: HAMP domain-containing sensor histidine kinase [Vicinamibacterales bacterium]
MSRLRNRLIVAFVASTMLPVAAAGWVASSLLDRSLGYGATDELDRLSHTLESTARQFYQLERETLRRDSSNPAQLATRFPSAESAAWPDPVRGFWDSGELEQFVLSGTGGDHLDLMRRTTAGVDLYRRDLGGIRMAALSSEFREARELVGATRARDLRRGLTLTLVLLIAGVWVVSLVPLIFIAHRISRPIQQLTAGLAGFAAGDWDRRLKPGRNDEVGRAIDAFNRMADQLRRNRDRLVYLTQMTSWQLLARKTAHELKNSLTPIRLTVEEMLARQPAADRAFMAQAAQIVVSEVETLERRVRAFSEFASEPPVQIERLDINAVVADRVSLLRPAHAGTSYSCRLDERQPTALAAADLVKGILTNLLENAADAAGPAGSILIVTRLEADGVALEVHDSGPGLSPDAADTLFEPTITFKKHGMGLGLSIARKNALLCGGDITVTTAALGGAAFRVMLPAAGSADAGTPA